MYASGQQRGSRLAHQGIGVCQATYQCFRGTACRHVAKSPRQDQENTTKTERTIPNSFALDPDSGLLLIADGFGTVLRWDGLSDEAEPAGVAPPTGTPVLAGSGSGSITGTYFAYVRFVDKYGLVSNLSPISASITITGKLQIDYSSIPIPTETKVVKRQILRNTTGQAQTVYVDVETTDLTTTTFTSTRSDANLATQEAVVIIDNEGLSLANLHTVPPNYKAFIAHVQDRMFYMGEVVYSEGNVAVTFGSKTVTGIGTEWTSAIAGRFLWVDGATEPYEIDTVDAVAQTLTLKEFYGGATDNYEFYAIRPAVAERRTVYYSEAGLAQSVPAVNAFTLAEDGDEITGPLVMRSFIYILERHHVWRVTFEKAPDTDGAIFLASLRGCVNHRCAVVVDDMAYMLDEQGVWAFGGGSESETASEQVQSLFRNDGQPGQKVNWASQRFFHAILYQPQETIRWFVSLSGDYLPKHAICYAYRLKRWWIEELAVPVGASCLGRLGPLAGGWRVGVEQVYLGSEARRVLAYHQGTLDGPDGQGTLSGIVTGSTGTTILDAAADYADSGLVGVPVTITGPIGNRAKGQTRVIVGVSGTTITVDRPWSVKPDTASEYQIGGVAWRYLGGWKQEAAGESDQRRTLEVGFKKTTADMTFDIRRYRDGSDSPETWGIDLEPEQNYGIASRKDNADLVCSMSGNRGYARQRIDDHAETDMDGQGRMRIELRGVTGPEHVTVYKLACDGVG